MPGALLVNYARSKHRHSRQRRQQHAAAEAAALEGGQGLREPLLAEAAQAAPLYSLWGSKLFWSGVVLLCISAGLLLLTAVNAVRSAPQA